MVLNEVIADSIKPKPERNYRLIEFSIDGRCLKYFYANGQIFVRDDAPSYARKKPSKANLPEPVEELAEPEIPEEVFEPTQWYG